MPRPLRLLLLAVALLAVAAPSAAAVDVPTRETLYRDGPDGRFLMGGEWLFRLDRENAGVRQRFMRQTSTAGWTPVTVPNAWNVGDDSNESMAGTIGWYRKDFKLPEAGSALDWIVRFESVNYRTRAWLNGRPIGSNKGAYIPFELRLTGLKRTGTNRLVVRVDSVRHPTDFPPSGLNVAGVPTGGWWNYGGILREVYLRRVKAVDFKEVDVSPALPCVTCDATVKVRTVLRNLGARARRVHVTARFGTRRLDLGTVTIAAGGLREAATSFRLANPRIWSPARPNLYKVRIDVTDGGGALAGYSLCSGVRSIKVAGGRLYLNGEAVNLRGVGYHEDTRQRGFAITNADRRWLFDEAKAIGATMMRTHYPPHPYLHELADERGMLLWSEIPVYAVKAIYLRERTVRVLAAAELRKNIEANRNHPSVAVWSIGNELSSKPGPTQSEYIRRAAKLANEIDGTRPVGIAVAGYPSAGCQPAYAPLDIIGINEYFGWYPGPNGQIFDRTRLSGYLDAMRACYPNEALMITEFGAEANRDGPVEEKGTWAHQQDFVNFHLGVYATKSWLSGTLYWALNEFRVRPGWDGGNPRPNSPIHQKGLETYDRVRKPAWYDVQRWFTKPYPLPAR